MKQHFSGLAIAILTFTLGWSISTFVLKPPGEVVIPPVAATRSEISPAWLILLSLQDRDLKQIKGVAQAQLKMAIDSLRGEVENNYNFLDPRIFSRQSTNHGEQRYVLVEESPLITIPGDSRLRISLFTQDGRLLESSEFGAGWRILLTEIRFTQVKAIRGTVLEVKSFPVINGADIARQYYALLGDKMRLIRLEDSSGALMPNYYSSPNHTIGFNQIGRSAADLEQSLKSNDVAEVLATLTWLGGVHFNVNEGDPGYLHEELSEARLVEEVRARPAVKTAVDALKHSDNRWVREAARSAAEIMH